ncbi:MAG: glycoside hydrolase family 16 protein [Saprospiraceae bacterium]|nr:glycoside hydrolase family 16 protein [Saprospiraceae bacterium]
MTLLARLLIIPFAFGLSLLSAQCPELIWADEFDGDGLNLSHWQFQNGDGCDQDLCGWGNNELQWYQSQNALVKDGKLTITARRESSGGKDYTSARIRSYNMAKWTYGRFEASIKMPTGRGMWPAFWMLSSTEPYGTWPQSGEIDVVEVVGHEPEIAHGTIHYGNLWPNNKSSGEAIALHTGTLADTFHRYAV